MAATATTGATMNYAERIARAQAEMARQGIDWLIIAPSSDLVYLMGYPAHTSERLTALVTPQSGGEPFVVVPRLEAPRLTDRNDLMEILDLRVFVDKSVVEVFANGRQAVMRRIYPTPGSDLKVKLFATGKAEFSSVRAWSMMPSNPY